MTNYLDLTIERVIYLHDQIVNQSGGSYGVRDRALLHSALERCKASFAGEDLYPDIISKAAALWHSLTMNHPFVDGNKRTGYEITKRFLYTNGYQVVASDNEVISFCIAVGSKQADHKQIITWLKASTQEL